MKREVVTPAARGCKRCGSRTVAWHQSERGKWYLIEVFKNGTGSNIASYRDFHSNYCNKPGEHERVQDEIQAEHDDDERDRQQAARRREDERIEQEANQLRAFEALSPSERAEFIEDFKRRIQRHLGLDPTMDYFSDQLKWRAEHAAMEAELAMYEDYMADLEEV